MQQVYTRSSTSIELVNSKHVSSLPRDWLSGRGRPSRDNHDGRERRDCVDDSTKSVQYLIIHEQWKGKVATAVAVRIRWADARRRNKKGKYSSVSNTIKVQCEAGTSGPPNLSSQRFFFVLSSLSLMANFDVRT